MNYTPGARVLLESGKVETVEGRLESSHPQLRIDPLGPLLICKVEGEDLIVKAESALMYFNDGLSETTVRFSELLLRIKNPKVKEVKGLPDIQQAA